MTDTKGRGNKPTEHQTPSVISIPDDEIFGTPTDVAQTLIEEMVRDDFLDGEEGDPSCLTDEPDIHPEPVEVSRTELEISVEAYGSSADPFDLENYQGEGVLVDDVLTGHDFTKFEIDPDRKDQLLDRVETMTPDEQQSLSDSLKDAWGKDSTILEASELVENLIDKARSSKVLAARQTAADKTLQHYHDMAARVSHLLNDGLSDKPLSSLKIDGIKEHVSKLNTDLTILSTAVYEMADMLSLQLPEDSNPDKPINVDAMVKVLTVVACGTKTWAVTYSEGLKQVKRLQKTIETLEGRIKMFEDDREEARLALLKKEELERKSVLSRGNWYAVMNANGQYITTMFAENEDGELRISPATLSVTSQRDDAAVFPTLEDAREVLDAVRRWSSNYPSVRSNLEKSGIYTDYLFIAESTLKKVEE